MNQQNELAVSCVLQWFQLACQKQRGAGSLVTLTFSKFVRKMIQGHLSAMPLCESRCKTKHGEGPSWFLVGEWEQFLSHSLTHPWLHCAGSAVSTLCAFNLHNHPMRKRCSSHHTDEETGHQGSRAACLWSHRVSIKAGLEPRRDFFLKHNTATSLIHICVYLCVHLDGRLSYKMLPLEEF